MAETNEQQAVSPDTEAAAGDITLGREEPRRLSREVLAVAGVCLLFGAILRLIHISYREIVGDEFFTLRFLDGGKPDLPKDILLGHLPLYYYMMQAWSKIADTGFEILLRLPSLVFGLLACLAFFCYARRYLRGTAFAICLLAFAMNPILVATSNDATPFALLTLWTVLSSFFCIRALDEGGTRNWCIYALVTALGALTHPLFWLLMVAQFGFAVGRPRRTPRTFVLISTAGIFVSLILMIIGAIFADRYFPKVLDVSAPSSSDLSRGIVSVLIGNIERYGSRTFVRALAYLFVLVTLALSVLYYRLRVAEASSVPDTILWVDETQDVVGHWNRLSLASFLVFQWVTLIVPAIGIVLLGSFAPDLRLHPVYFIVCLPSMVILVAAGIDALPSRIGTFIMGLLFVVLMAGYDYQALTDRGIGVRAAVERLRKDEFDPQKDVLLYAVYGGVENSVKRYAVGIPGVPIRNKEVTSETQALLQRSIEGKERVFVLYHNDIRHYRGMQRAAIRDWMRQRHDLKLDKQHSLSPPEGSELWIYVRRPK